MRQEEVQKELEAEKVQRDGLGGLPSELIEDDTNFESREFEINDGNEIAT